MIKIDVIKLIPETITSLPWSVISIHRAKCGLLNSRLRELLEPKILQKEAT